jgi:hypothetical protein
MRQLTLLLCALPLAGCTIAESRPVDSSASRPAKSLAGA